MIRKKPSEESPKARRTRSSGNKKRFLGIVFLILAILCIVGLTYMFKSMDYAEKVAVAAEDITKGSLITQENLTMAERGTYGCDGFYTDASELVGAYANVDIIKGDIVTSGKVEGSAGQDAITTITTEGQNLLTVTIQSGAAGVSSHLQSGDLVNIWVIEEIYNETTFEYASAPVLYDDLKNIEVYAVENSEGIDTDTTVDGNESMPATVTLLVSDNPQIEKLLRAEYTGSLHLELVKR